MSKFNFSLSKTFKKVPSYMRKVWSILKDNWQPITAIASMLIALASLFLSTYSAYLARKHNTLSVKPGVIIYAETNKVDDTVIIQFDILNNGLGPAIIKNYKIF